MADDESRYPTDRQMTNLINAIRAMSATVEGQTDALASIMNLVVEPQANLRVAYDAMIEATGQLADAVKVMRHAQQEQASARKVSEATHTTGCQHVLVVYRGQDGIYNDVIGCERCHTSIDATSGIGQALLRALALQGDGAPGVR